MREWLSGGVSPCQGEGRGFESRLALSGFWKQDRLKQNMREWLSGGVSPCQGEGRGFESRLALDGPDRLLSGLFLRYGDVPAHTCPG